jgi:hypothetical protein
MRDWKSEWLPAIWKEADRVSKAPSWNPKIVRLEGSLVMIDLAMMGQPKNNRVDMPVEILVMRHEDHPFLKVLNEMPHVPRAVKAIYRKENRMKYARADEYWPFHYDMHMAEAAWNKYKEARE